MTANKLKELKKKKEISKGNSPFTSLVSGNFLGKENIVKHLPFISFLSLLMLLYIANGYYAEDTVRALNRVANDLKEMRSEYISTKSELMFRSKQSEIAKLLGKYEVRESVVPPKKLVVTKDKK